MTNSLSKYKNFITLFTVLVLFLIVGVIYKYSQQTSQNIPSSNLVVPTATPTSKVSPTPQPALTPTQNQTYTVKVYFSKHPDSDNDPSLTFPVNRISSTSGVATFAINQLIKGPTSSEASNNYYSAIQGYLSGSSSCSNQDFKITLNKKGSVDEQGTATLQFCRVVNIPGELAGYRMQSEIQTTLLQFGSIKKVVILNQSGHCFNDLSGLNKCLQ